MSDILANFRNQTLQQVNPLSKLSSGIFQTLQKKQQQDALNAQKALYQDALANWQADPTLENQTALWQATPEGMQKGLSSLFESASEEEKLGKVQFYNDILGYTSAGEIDLAIESALAGSKAFDTTDPRNSKISATIAEKLKEGDVQGAKTFINQMLMATPEGQELLGTRIDMDTSERADKQLTLDEKTEERLGIKAEVDNYIAMQGLDLTDEEQAAHYATAEALGMDGLRKNLFFAGKKEAGIPLSPSEEVAWTETYRRTYENTTKAGRAATDAVAKIDSTMTILDDLGSGDELLPAKGLADVALMNFLQRGIIDQGVSVRSEDVKTLTGSAGGAQSVLTFLKSLKSGDLLSAGQREVIRKIASDIEQKTWQDLEREIRPTWNSVKANGLDPTQAFATNDMQNWMYKNLDLSDEQGFNLLIHGRDINNPETADYMWENFPDEMEAYTDYALGITEE